MKMLRKKKKGFTLIELIAVIAILAILGVILVPKLAGYSNNARKATDLSNAKQLIQAVELYDNDNATPLDENTVMSTATIKTAMTAHLTWPTKQIQTPYSIPAVGSGTALAVVSGTSWDALTIAQLRLFGAALETL